MPLDITMISYHLSGDDSRTESWVMLGHDEGHYRVRSVCCVRVLMSKRFERLRSAYCSTRDSVTGDHIFAREFFLPAARAGLPQAPACDVCHNNRSKLKHYLTAVLPFGGRHSAAAQNLASMVPKRLSKNARLHRELGAGHPDSREPRLLPRKATLRRP
jgi:hypothetical protein